MEPDMRLECDAKDLLDKGDPWKKIRDDILKRVCAALNSHHDGDEDTAQSQWSLRIHIKQKEYPNGFVQALAERIEDKLNNMVQKSRFSQIFAFEEGKDHVTLRIRQSAHGVATLNFKSPEATEKGLVGISADRFCFFMFGSCHDGDGNTRRSDTLSREKVFEGRLRNGQTIAVQESPYLQLKALEPNKATENIKKAGSKAATFSPESGRDFVEWLWNRSTRTLGEYVAAFAKNKGKGGFFYCGLEEKSSEINLGAKKKKLTTGVKVRALELEEAWKQEIKTGLNKKIREEMLWVKGDPSAGYHILEPKDVKEDQVKVDFIEVEGEAKSGCQLYLLEVKVSPFHGVVFNDKDGPEAYTLQRTQGPDGYTPVQMQKEQWFQKMSDLGWCSKHRVAKDIKCGTCFLCSQCRYLAMEDKTCVDHRISGTQQCERCSILDMESVQNVLP